MRQYSFVPAAMLAAALSACGGEGPAGPPTAVASLNTGVLSATVGEALTDPVKVRVTDAQGGGVPDVEVTFAVVSGSGSISAISAASTSIAPTMHVVGTTASTIVDSTDANGETGVVWTLGTKAGSQSVSATVVDLTPVLFNATAVAGEPAHLRFHESSGLVGPTGSSIDEPLAALVTDEHDNPVSGVTVSWQALSAGATVGAATSATSVSGLATAAATLGTIPGLYLFRAAVGETADTTITVAVTTMLDPQGDAFSTGITGYVSADVTRIGTAVVNDTLYLYTYFADSVSVDGSGAPVVSNTMYGTYDLDLDQDTTTGYILFRQCLGGPPLNFGTDGLVDLFLEPGGRAPLARVDSLDTGDRCSSGFWGDTSSAPVILEPHSVTLKIDLAFLGDDGAFAFSGLVWHPDETDTLRLTDIVPDSAAWVFSGASATASQIPERARIERSSLLLPRAADEMNHRLVRTSRLITRRRRR